MIRREAYVIYVVLCRMIEIGETDSLALTIVIFARLAIRCIDQITSQLFDI